MVITLLLRVISPLVIIVRPHLVGNSPNGVLTTAKPDPGVGIYPPLSDAGSAPACTQSEVCMTDPSPLGN